MVFSLVLHSAHEKQPKEVLVSVVSASHDLVVNKGHFWIQGESHFFLVVADQHEGSEEST